VKIGRPTSIFEHIPQQAISRLEPDANVGVTGHESDLRFQYSAMDKSLGFVMWAPHLAAVLHAGRISHIGRTCESHHEVDTTTRRPHEGDELMH
jgi:hypothetical protein